MTGRSKSRRTRRVRRASSGRWKARPRDSKDGNTTESIKDEILASDWKKELRERLNAVNSEFFE